VCVGDRLNDFGQVGCPADRLEITCLFQPLDQQRGVDPFTFLVQRQQMREQFHVGVGVEVVPTHDQRDLVAHIAVQQQATQHPFFGVEVLRRQSIQDLRTHSPGGLTGSGMFSSGHVNPCSIGGKGERRTPFPIYRILKGR